MGYSSSNYDITWVEKYRPIRVADNVGNVDAVSRLEIIARDGNMPNLILSDPPGTGKTTSILALAHELLGANYKDAVLELNASDDRGIYVVRNKIKMFAQKKVTLSPGRHKVVILDEADSMTSGAQQALRQTIEIYSNSTRFALACNTSAKIIEPIQSRCAIVRFSRLSDQEILGRLMIVVEAEKARRNPQETMEGDAVVGEGASEIKRVVRRSLGEREDKSEGGTRTDREINRLMERYYEEEMFLHWSYNPGTALVKETLL